MHLLRRTIPFKTYPRTEICSAGTALIGDIGKLFAQNHHYLILIRPTLAGMAPSVSNKKKFVATVLARDTTVLNVVKCSQIDIEEHHPGGDGTRTMVRGMITGPPCTIERITIQGVVMDHTTRIGRGTDPHPILHNDRAGATQVSREQE